MSDDLLKRLKNLMCDCVRSPIRTLKTNDLAEALDDAHSEISRLREALHDLAYNWECCLVLKAMRQVARDALEAKK